MKRKSPETERKALPLTAFSGVFLGPKFLVRRRSRHVECGHLLALLKRPGESGLIRNVNFA
jgi:hypothetical protein